MAEECRGSGQKSSRKSYTLRIDQHAQTADEVLFKLALTLIVIVLESSDS